MDDEMTRAAWALLEPHAQWSSDDALCVPLDTVIDFLRFRVRGAELYTGEDTRTKEERMHVWWKP